MGPWENFLSWTYMQPRNLAPAKSPFRYLSFPSPHRSLSRPVDSSFLGKQMDAWSKLKGVILKSADPTNDETSICLNSFLYRITDQTAKYMEETLSYPCQNFHGSVFWEALIEVVDAAIAPSKVHKTFEIYSNTYPSAVPVIQRLHLWYAVKHKRLWQQCINQGNCFHQDQIRCHEDRPSKV